MRYARRTGTFRIRVPQSKWYFNVTIYPDRRTMHNAERANNPQSRSYKFFARCVSHYPTKRRLPNKPCDHGFLAGDVMFAAPYVGSGIVAHELTHAALSYVLSCGTTKFHREEADERLADIVGSLTSQFWTKWWKLEKQKP